MLASAPLTSKGQALGALTLGSARRDAIPPEGSELLTAIGRQIGVAIENARLYQQAEIAAALEERQRIAADMHDGLAQTISYLGHQVDETAAHVEEGRIAEALTECERIRKALDQASTDVRYSIASLREAPQPRRSVQEALGALIASLAPEMGPEVSFEHDGEAGVYLAPVYLDQVLRVAREAVLNALRHARANSIAVRFRVDAGEALVTVEDDGVGFDPGAPLTDGRDHFGMSIMRARAARLGGRVVIDAAPGRGARIELRWTLRA
jgi:two-component system nitrate/nitrite sensor histidine kinase NarX